MPLKQVTVATLLFLFVTMASPSLGGPAVGDVAPDFTLKGTDDKDHNLKTALETHEAAILIFVSTKCPYSNLYNDRYNQIVEGLKKKAPKKVAFFPINSNLGESLSDVKAHAVDKKFTFTVFKDESYKVADAYGAEKTPEAFLIGKSGKILYHGRIDDNSEGLDIKHRDLVAAVDEAVAGKAVTIKETRSFGCAIKRK